MLPEEEFKSRLRDDLRTRQSPHVGSLTADAVAQGRRLHKRQRTARLLGGTAAVVAVAVGSVTVSSAFGSSVSHQSAGASGGSSVAGDGTLTVPASWTVPAEAPVADGDWITPQAIVAETQALLAGGGGTTAYFAGGYTSAEGDPRSKWAVDGSLELTTAQGTTHVTVSVSSSGTVAACAPSQAPPAAPAPPPTMCGETTLGDGTKILLRHWWATNAKVGAEMGAYVWVFRPDGLTVRVSTLAASVVSDDQLFALASSGQWGQKMDKTFVHHAGETVTGDFTPPPS